MVTAEIQLIDDPNAHGGTDGGGGDGGGEEFT